MPRFARTDERGGYLVGRGRTAASANDAGSPGKQTPARSPSRRLAGSNWLGLGVGPWRQASAGRATSRAIAKATPPPCWAHVKGGLLDALSGARCRSEPRGHASCPCRRVARSDRARKARFGGRALVVRSSGNRSPAWRGSRSTSRMNCRREVKRPSPPRSSDDAPDVLDRLLRDEQQPADDRETGSYLAERSRCRETRPQQRGSRWREGPSWQSRRAWRLGHSGRSRAGIRRPSELEGAVSDSDSSICAPVFPASLSEFA